MPAASSGHQILGGWGVAVGGRGRWAGPHRQVSEQSVVKIVITACIAVDNVPRVIRFFVHTYVLACTSYMYMPCTSYMYMPCTSYMYMHPLVDKGWYR